MSIRLSRRERPRRPPSLSFGATTEYHRSGQSTDPLDPLSSWRRRKASAAMSAAVCCSSRPATGVAVADRSPEGTRHGGVPTRRPDSTAPRPKPLHRRLDGRLWGRSPNQARVLQRNVHSPTEIGGLSPTSSTLTRHGTTEVAPNRVKPGHPSRRLQRQRVRARLLPLRHDNHPHRSAAGDRGALGKPSARQSSPTGPRLYLPPPEGDRSEQTVHERTARAASPPQCFQPASRSAARPSSRRERRSEHRLSSSRSPKALAGREIPREGRAQPRSNPEEHCRGLATRSVKARNGFERRPEPKCKARLSPAATEAATDGPSANRPPK